MKRRITELKKLFKVAEVTVTRTDTIGQLKTNQKVNKNIVGNVKDETFQNQLIRDYLERQYLLEDSELDKICEINSELNSHIDDSDSAGNILWTSQRHLSFLICFPMEKEISSGSIRHKVLWVSLLLMQVVNLLFGMHLSFCIYDKTSRTTLSKNVLNNRKSTFYCKFNFEIDGVDYFIERRA